MQKRTISDFYDNDFPAYGSYDNARKICGIDGLKISQRKLIWTGFKRCAKEFIKTDTFCAQAQIDTAYVHGSGNLGVVADGMCASYVGSNNYPLFTGNTGGFGCRIVPRASANRYTRLKLAEITKVLFNQLDNEILEKQYFEGQYIEPKYLMPIFPLVFLNGSSGLSTGFSQDIFPRNPEEIINYIKKRLAGTEHPRMDLLPWFKGHIGKVEVNKELNNVESFGVITRNNTTNYTITELPIGMEYQKYCEVLDKLIENGTIQDYDDKCDPKTDKILFEIKTTREFTKHHDGRKLYETMRLIKSLPETLNCIDENGRVKEFRSIQEILDSFIDIRLEFYRKRKAYLQKLFGDELEKLNSRYMFCEGIIKKTIKVANVKKDDIIKQLEAIKKIVKVNDSFDYLLSMPIHSVTVEKLEELKNQIEAKKAELNGITLKSIEDMWIEDLHELKKHL